MAEFVNYKNRSVTLPPGCNDLIDLLRRPSRPAAGGRTANLRYPNLTQDESGMVSLVESSRYVAKLFDSPAEAVLFTLILPDQRLTCHIGRIEGKPMLASVIFQKNNHRERLMRMFFLLHDLPLPEDHGTPPPYVPGVPAHLVFRISSLPLTAAGVSTLIVDMFHSVCNLNDDAQLAFRYSEMAHAA